jgi:hypothetical protein
MCSIQKKNSAKFRYSYNRYTNKLSMLKQNRILPFPLIVLVAIFIFRIWLLTPFALALLFCLSFFTLKMRCDERFSHAFTACGCVFEEITLVGSYQGNYFENATTCSNRTLKTTVATQLYKVFFYIFTRNGSSLKSSSPSLLLLSSLVESKHFYQKKLYRALGN